MTKELQAFNVELPLKPKLLLMLRWRDMLKSGHLVWSPLFSLKYVVALPSLMIRDSEFFIKAFIKFINSVPHSIFFKTHSKKEWFVESNVFSISTVNI